MDSNFEHIAPYLAKYVPECAEKLIYALELTKSCYVDTRKILEESVGERVQESVKHGLYEDALAQVTYCRDISALISEIDKQIKHLTIKNETANSGKKTEEINKEETCTANSQSATAASPEGTYNRKNSSSDGYQIISFHGIIEENTNVAVQRCYITVERQTLINAWLDQEGRIIYVAEHLFNRHQEILSSGSIQLQLSLNGSVSTVKAEHA